MATTSLSAVSLDMQDAMLDTLDGPVDDDLDAHWNPNRLAYLHPDRIAKMFLLPQIKAHIDKWVTSQRDMLASRRKAHEADMAAQQREHASVEAQAKKVQRVYDTMQQELEGKRQQLASMTALLEEAHQTAEELPQRISAREDELDEREKQLREAEDAFATSEEERKMHVHRVTHGIKWYQERLGLAFERRPNNALKFFFEKIDPKDPTRVFSFALKLWKKQFNISVCEPMVDYSDAIAQLNASNDMSRFLILMRREFKKTLV